jgi:MerR family transcriptional regulator, light-induced transcriptional regulator
MHTYAKLSPMTDPASHFDRPAAGPGIAAKDFLSALLAAAAVKSPRGMRDQLDRSVLTLGLGGCVDDVLLPAMQQVGTRWQHGQLDIQTECLTTETVRGWLERVALRAPKPDPVAPLVLACGPSERHSIGLEALGLLLRYQRRPCRMLGPRTSIVALSAAVQANKPSAVVIVSHLRATRLGAIQALLAAADLGANLFYAGDAFAAAGLRHDIPGTYLGTNIQAACSAIIKATGSQSQ